MSCGLYKKIASAFAPAVELSETLADLNEVAFGHGCCGRGILGSSDSPLQRGILLAESHQRLCKPLIAEASVVAP